LLVVLLNKMTFTSEQPDRLMPEFVLHVSLVNYGQVTRLF